MPNTDFGPVQIRRGNQAEFAIKLTDSTGASVTVSSAEVDIVYTNTSFASQTDVVNLTLSAGVWTGTWSSTSATACLASWSVIAAGSTSSVQNGQLRIFDP